MVGAKGVRGEEGLRFYNTNAFLVIFLATPKLNNVGLPSEILYSVVNFHMILLLSVELNILECLYVKKKKTFGERKNEVSGKKVGKEG